MTLFNRWNDPKCQALKHCTYSFHFCSLWRDQKVVWICTGYSTVSWSKDRCLWLNQHTFLGQYLAGKERAGLSKGTNTLWHGNACFYSWVGRAQGRSSRRSEHKRLLVIMPQDCDHWAQGLHNRKLPKHLKGARSLKKLCYVTRLAHCSRLFRLATRFLGQGKGCLALSRSSCWLRWSDVVHRRARSTGYLWRKVWHALCIWHHRKATCDELLLDLFQPRSLFLGSRHFATILWCWMQKIIWMRFFTLTGQVYITMYCTSTTSEMTATEKPIRSCSRALLLI